jgi:predicted transcriptional regulator
MIRSFVNFFKKGKKMLTVEQIQERLADANLSKVAERCGVHYATLYRLIKGHEPMYATVKALSDYLTQKDVEHNG